MAAMTNSGMTTDLSGSIKTEPGTFSASSTSHAASSAGGGAATGHHTHKSAVMRPRLELLLNDHVLPYDMTIFHAVKQYGNFTQEMPESETETEAVNLAHVQIFANTHILYYRPVKLQHQQPVPQKQQQDDVAKAVSATLASLESATKASLSAATSAPTAAQSSRAQPFLRSVSSRTSAALEKSPLTHTSPSSATKKSRHQLTPNTSSNNNTASESVMPLAAVLPAAGSIAKPSITVAPDFMQHEPFNRDPEFSSVWTACEAKAPRSRLARILDSDLTALFQLADPSCEVIALLRVLDALNELWAELYHPQIKPMPRIPEAEFFYNSKIVTKVNRQLQEPVIVLTGQLPQWLVPIGRHAKFLLPFITRLQLFYTTALDRDRALHRLLETNPDVSASLSAATRGAQQGGASAAGGAAGGSASHYYSASHSSSDSAFAPRLEKRRKTVNRNRVLQDGKRLFKDNASTFALLEIQFEDEVGTGLGPTLEFYSLVSHELRRRSLNMWHVSDDTTQQSRSNNAYVHTPFNLFPAPIGPHTSASAVKELQDNFRFLGQFMAKAVMDFRILDLPLNPVLFMHVFGQQEYLGMGELAIVDPDLEKSLHKFHQAAHKKLWLETESKMNETDMRAAVNAINIDGCSVEDLWITFTLPGYPDFELCKGGKDKRVTLDNVSQYVDLVLYWFLRGGVRLQCDAFREGFNSVFPVNRLELFKPEELEFVFCGYSDYCDGDGGAESSMWDVKSLIETCNPDHGFTHDSAAIKWLFEIMGSFTGQERREFLQFVTGCPKLPIGGFRALTPPLTIVRRTVNPGEKSDDYLPSVMTCVNYLKLPEYSSMEYMRNRLRMACSEGRFHFHLS